MNKIASFFLIFLIFSFLFPKFEARRLHGDDEQLMVFESMKNSGPSKGGAGHRVRHLQISSVNRQSGPSSPGIGHKFLKGRKN
ncbi:hypothetical protein RND81_14G236600 [Saponaria officinalis]|uniref:Uncharacterized protein n=1 Tax=Saponaria officinalis TaxID=3572 RepID=A0AAW1H181_SAPOF